MLRLCAEQELEGQKGVQAKFYREEENRGCAGVQQGIRGNLMSYSKK